MRALQHLAAFGVVVWAGVVATPAWTQDMPIQSRTMQAANERSPTGIAGSFAWENDIFGGTDQNYTNGVYLELTSEPRRHLPLTALLARFAPDLYQPDSGIWRTGLSLGHEIYTPRDISAENPDPEDRPYAGYFYSTASLYAVQKNVLDSWHLTVGLVGDGAGAEFVQTNFHRLIDGEDPKGYRFQLKSEPVVNFRVNRQLRTDAVRFAGLQWDAGASAGGSLGNANTSASFGGGVRVGQNISGDFGPPRPHPNITGATFFDNTQRFAWYLFADTGGRVVARDIFLDGNTFQDSRSVDRNPFYWDMQGGLAIELGVLRATFTYVQRSEQFENQDGVTRFGSGSISVRF